jgi:peptide/nickel transport system substrate-binding protein
MWEGGPSGVASIKRVVIKNIDEWGTRLSMFQAGDADYIYTPPVYRPQLNPQLRFDCGNDEASCKEVNPKGYIRGYRLRPQPAETPLQLNWNINVEGGNPYLGSGQLDGSGAPPDMFSDIHVRRAFNYCFDYSAMVKDALSGEGIQAQGPIIQGMIGYIDGMEPPFSFDLEKCAEEFKLADLDKDGIPAGEDTDDIWNLGFYLQMTYNSGNDTRRMSLEIMKSGIEQVNPKFTVQVVALPFAVQMESRRQGRLPIVAQGWVEDFHDPHNWVRPFLHSQGAFGRVIRLPEELATQIDALIAEGTSYTDPEKRQVVYEKLQKLATDQAINVWMYQQLDANYFQTWVHGFYYNPAYGNPEYGWVYSLSKVAP